MRPARPAPSRPPAPAFRVALVAVALLAVVPAAASGDGPSASAGASSAARAAEAPASFGTTAAVRGRASTPAAGRDRVAAGAPARTRIVGGASVPIAVAPYQVRIRARSDGRPWGSPGPYRYSTCGGALIDALRVVTAAHCVLDGMVPTAAASFRVDLGSSRFEAAAGSGGDPQPQAGDTPQSRGVAEVRRHPGYVVKPGDSGTLEDLTDDVAVLTLAASVGHDANVAPIALAEPGPSPTGIARVSGYGLQAEGGRADGALHAIDMPLVDAALDESAEGAGPLNALYAVTRSPTGSTCHGDSGGPVVQDGRLIGLVSSGPSCGAGSPGNHTLIAAREIRDFVLGDDTPPVAPRGGRDVAVRGPSRPRTGDVLRCFPGRWTAAPSLVVQFVDARSGTVLQGGPDARYRLVRGDAGRRVACRAVATTEGGVGRTPLSRPTRSVAPGAPDRLRATLSSAARVGRRGRLAVRVRIRASGPVAATAIRTCVRPGPWFRISRRGGGTIVDGRLCWTTPTATRGAVRRFELAPRRHARRGRALAATASVTAPAMGRASTSRRVTVR